MRMDKETKIAWPCPGVTKLWTGYGDILNGMSN